MLVSPCEIAVIQRGIKFSVAFPKIPEKGSGSSEDDCTG